MTQLILFDTWLTELQAAINEKVRLPVRFTLSDYMQLTMLPITMKEGLTVSLGTRSDRSPETIPELADQWSSMLNEKIIEATKAFNSGVRLRRIGRHL